MRAIAKFYNPRGDMIVSRDVTRTVVELFGSVEYLQELEKEDEDKYNEMVDVVVSDELYKELSDELEYENEYIDVYLIEFV